jgi:hypothetical protein
LYIVRNDWRRNNVQVTSFFEEINEGVADTIAAPCGFFLHLWGTLREPNGKAFLSPRRSQALPWKAEKPSSPEKP